MDVDLDVDELVRAETVADSFEVSVGWLELSVFSAFVVVGTAEIPRINHNTVDGGMFGMLFLAFVVSRTETKEMGKEREGQFTTIAIELSQGSYGKTQLRLLMSAGRYDSSLDSSLDNKRKMIYARMAGLVKGSNSLETFVRALISVIQGYPRSDQSV